LREEGESGIGMKSLANFPDVLHPLTERNGLTWAEPERMPETGSLAAVFRY
jgi:hypothetical protein